VKRSERSRFGAGEAAQFVFGPGVVQLPADITVAPRTLAGESATEDLRVRTVYITQKDADTVALRIDASSSPGAGTNLLEARDSSGALITGIGTDGRLSTTQYIVIDERTTPAAAGANQVRLYAKDKGGVSWLYFINDAGTDVEVASANVVKQALTATATWNPGSIADAAVASTTITVTGAAVGDIAYATHDQFGAVDVLISAHVQAADTVRVVFMNKTGGALDVASGTLRVVVWDVT
jgi:hypothetical protein